MKSNGLTLKGNGKIFIGIPRERVSINPFIDNRDMILARLNDIGRLGGLLQADGHRVDRNRDHIVRAFLRSDAEFLLMLDSDMQHPVRAPERLAEWRVPVVGALYFHRGRSHRPFVFRRVTEDLHTDQYGRQFHQWEPLSDAVYNWLIDHKMPMRDGAVTIDSPLRNPLWGPEEDVHAVATGCMLIHRALIEAMEPPLFEYEHGWSSEDLDFCVKVTDMGIPIHADVSVICGHYREVAMGQSQFRLIYEAGGKSAAEIRFPQIVSQLAEFLGQPYGQIEEMLENYQPSTLADLWENWSTAGTFDEFYKDEEVGLLYLLDLVRWNSSPMFRGFQDALMKVRDKLIYEIGSGIGTMSMQLAAQRNYVFSFEPNDLLRKFSSFRWKQAGDKVPGRDDRIVFLPDLMGVTLYVVEKEVDMVVAIDVFEHLDVSHLERMIDSCAYILKKRGRMYVHNNWGQQDIYPMHFDHSMIWEDMLAKRGLYHWSDNWVVKA